MGRRPASRSKGQLPRGRHKLTREHVAESQRRRILDGALTVVAANGYADAGLKEITGTAGVSTKAFYEHFDSLHTAFLAAFDERLAALTERTRQAYMAAATSSPNAWPAQVRAAALAALGYLHEHRAAAKACLVEAPAADSRVRARRDAALAQLSCIAKDGNRLASHEVPDPAARAAVAGAIELIAAELARSKRSRLERLAPDIVYVLVVPFLGPGRALSERRRTAETLARP
jgi:AcrR family transcriptional regulator